ncbi:MAG: hypothetical protein NT069_02825 [Planctomycetota bacterium]|nr:hypothetical protein [Planctomycetota bacterium]
MKLSIGGQFRHSSRQIGKTLIKLGPQLQSLKDAFAACSCPSDRVECFALMLVDEPVGHFHVVSVDPEAFVVEIGCEPLVSPADIAALLLSLITSELPRAIDVSSKSVSEKEALKQIVAQWEKNDSVNK